MGAVEDSLSPARMGDGFVYWVEIPGIDKPLVGLADRRGMDEMMSALAENPDRIVFSGITIPGEKTSTGKPIHVGAAVVLLPDTPALLRYDDAFSGLPGGGDDEDADDDRRDDRPQRSGGISPLGSLKRT